MQGGRQIHSPLKTILPTSLVYLTCMKIIICTIFLVIGMATANAQPGDIRQKSFNVKKNLALQGYDPVSYFDGKAQEGNSKFAVEYKGILYNFSSGNNAAKFRLNPDKYEPAYGGWCAYAMGEKGEKVKVDPETFKVINGKLYLFYNFWGNNTLEDWNKNEKPLKEKADANWKKLTGIESETG
jgi:YHS domain-containing protein